jgi:hypothetical protein
MMSHRILRCQQASSLVSTIHMHTNLSLAIQPAITCRPMYRHVCCCDVIRFMLSTTSSHHDQCTHQRKVQGHNDDECCLRGCYIDI